MFSRAECAEAVAALERLDIARTALQPAGTLSGGQQQRVAIARALMQQPKVILADEPIASLDPLNAKVVMDSLQDINLREGITVVTNLHTLDTARTYCNRIIGMAHRFCRTCGIHPFAEDVQEGGERSAYVNLNCVADIDPSTLSIFDFDGRSA